MRVFLSLLTVLFFLVNSGFCQSINDLIPKGEVFYIQSAQEYGKSDRGYWDIPGGEENIREDAQIKVWAIADAARDRRYVIENSPTAGFVKIHIDGIAGYLDIPGGDNSNGAKLKIFNKNNGWNQNFSFKYLGNGRFKIYSQNGKSVCLGGRNSQNGSELVMWDDHDGPWMEWVLISVKTKKPLLLEDKLAQSRKNEGADMTGIKSFYIQSALSYGKNLTGYFDVPGTKYPEKGNNLQIWELSDFSPDRFFEVTQSTSDISYYNITVAGNSNLVVDVANGSDADGTNVGIYERNNSPAQNFLFKHLGNGRFKIFAQNKKVVCTGREPHNGTNIHLWSDHEGLWMEWYLIDAETNKPFIPKGSEIDITAVSNNSPNPEVKALFSRIDNSYNNLNNIQTQSGNLISKLRNANGIIGKGYRTSDLIGDIDSKVTDTESAINPFGKFPIIGPPVKVLSTSLKFSLSNAGKVNTTMKGMRTGVIDKCNDNISYALKSNILLNSKVNYLNGMLYDEKKALSGMNTTHDADSIVVRVNALNQRLNNISAATGSIPNNLSEIDKHSGNFKKLERPLDDVNGGLDKFNNEFRKVDRIADDINKVLEKRFKKQIATVKINISVRDVLEGGKVGKLFDKYVNEFLDDAFKPLIKRLDIKLPGIPNIDNLKTAFDESLDVSKVIRTNADEINKALMNLN